MTTGTDNKKKRKILAFVVAGMILQTLIIVLFVVFVTRARTPKVRLGSVSVENVNVISSPNSPSFSLKLNARVTVKNTNFGPYKFDNSKVIVSYRGTQVGEATIFKARAKLRSTKKFNVTVSLNSNEVSSNSHLGSDVNSNNLTFNARAKLNGKVHVLGVFKKNKSAEMNCTFVVYTSTKIINDLSCK